MKPAFLESDVIGDDRPHIGGYVLCYYRDWAIKGCDLRTSGLQYRECGRLGALFKWFECGCHDILGHLKGRSGIAWFHGMMIEGFLDGEEDCSVDSLAKELLGACFKCQRYQCAHVSLVLAGVCLEQLDAFDVVSTSRVCQLWFGDIKQNLYMSVTKNVLSRNLPHLIALP